MLSLQHFEAFLFVNTVFYSQICNQNMNVCVKELCFIWDITIWFGADIQTHTQVFCSRFAFRATGENAACWHRAGLGGLLWHLLSDTATAQQHTDASTEPLGCQIGANTPMDPHKNTNGCIWVPPALVFCFLTAGASVLLTRINRNGGLSLISNQFSPTKESLHRLKPVLEKEISKIITAPVCRCS